MNVEGYAFPITMGLNDLESGLALTRKASWNQIIEDWETFLSLGRLRSVITKRGDIVGTIGILPLGSDVSWISLVLVAPEHRGRGLAQQMMEWAVACAKEEGWTAMLDATEAGSRVYRKFGFVETGKLFRCEVTLHGELDTGDLSETLIPLEAVNLEEVIAWDFEQSGLDREQLLTHWIGNEKAIGWMSRGAAGEIRGYSLSRPGYYMPQVGPVFADQIELVVEHMSGHLRQRGSPVLMDLTENAITALKETGKFELEIKREFLRMGLGRDRPGIPSKQYAIAGPEFG